MKGGDRIVQHEIRVSGIAGAPHGLAVRRLGADVDPEWPRRRRERGGCAVDDRPPSGHSVGGYQQVVERCHHVVVSLIGDNDQDVEIACRRAKSPRVADPCL